jgi:hypothetical protein
VEFKLGPLGTSATEWTIVPIMMMENLVEWTLAGGTEVLGENLPQRHFVHHKFHLTRPGYEPGPPRWEELVLIRNSNSSIMDSKIIC